MKTEETFSQSGEPIYKVEIIYQGSVSYEENFYMHGKLDKISENILNENGDVIKTTAYDVDNDFTRITEYSYEYDEYNNWIKQIGKEDGKIKYITEREIIYK